MMQGTFLDGRTSQQRALWSFRRQPSTIALDSKFPTPRRHDRLIVYMRIYMSTTSASVIRRGAAVSMVPYRSRKVMSVFPLALWSDSYSAMQNFDCL